MYSLKFVLKSGSELHFDNLDPTKIILYYSEDSIGDVFNLSIVANKIGLLKNHWSNIKNIPLENIASIAVYQDDTEIYFIDNNITRILYTIDFYPNLQEKIFISYK